MVIYEVTAVVDAEIRAEFEDFMVGGHIPDVISTGYFDGATFFHAGDRYRILYEAKGQQQIDEYIKMAAPALRSDFLRRFPTGVSHSREIWNVVSVHDIS